MKLNATEENVYRAVDSLLKMNKVKVTSATVREKLWLHPDFPGLTAISDVLDELNVPHMTAKLSPDMLSTIPVPALLMLNVDGGMMATVRSVSEGKVEWLHTGEGIRKEAIEDFGKKWTGVVLMSEYSELAGDPEFEKKKKLERQDHFRMVAFAMAAAVSLCGTLFYSPGHLTADVKAPFFELLVLKCLGLIMSLILVWYNLDSSNSYLRRICQNSQHFNCRSLLESMAGRFLGVNWSEIGLIYFLATLSVMVFSLLSRHVPELLAWLILVNMITIPYTFYSVYYQAFVARRWCLLCLAAQVVLWAEFWVGFHYTSERSLMFVSNVLPVFLIVVPILLLFWWIIKKGLIASLRLPAVEKTIEQLKFDAGYVQALFGKNKYIPAFFEQMKIGRLGNPDAANVLTVVTNPSCEACAQVHGQVRELVSVSADVQVQIVFSASTAPGDESGVVVKKLLNLPETEIPGWLEKWFLLRFLGKSRWLKCIESVPSDHSADRQLELHLSWIELAGISTTPALFLNGHELPRLYAVRDVEKLCRLIRVNGDLVRY
ncbi:vitamin K epoxide reductase family protein [Dyadobacter crusticola]|uniref:vitamin K epoxide reductase family protein n=1 Tax=Dyadobacter crusticola TaxID=292407 RepID=UPI0004E160CD|nr:vitamin K epoxide reductase family protein [Dyadobacter crusticola]